MYINQTMKELPDSERPYEKCLEYGPESLSDAELLAVILRSGTKGISSLQLARKILHLCPGEKGLAGIYHLGFSQLEALAGIGTVKAVQIKCIGEISKRIARRSARERLRMDNAATIADYYMETLRHEEQELVYCLMLDTRNHFLADECLSKGTVNAALISPRELFIKALERRAVQVVLVHNHPGGDPLPSQEDLDVTERIFAAGEMLGIRLLDHIIIGDFAYYSIMEHHKIE